MLFLLLYFLCFPLSYVDMTDMIIAHNWAESFMQLIFSIPSKEIYIKTFALKSFSASLTLFLHGILEVKLVAKKSAN